MQEGEIKLNNLDCFAFEIDKLKSILARIATKCSFIQESMKFHLTVTDKNIFWQTSKTKEKTNPVLTEMYIDFRENYFKSVITKQLIAQALYEKINNKDNLKELDFIERYYQNWGIPEEDTINPHFTFTYNYSASKDSVKKMVENIEIPQELLQKVCFNKIAILEIDFWGNPVKNLYEVSLKQTIS